MKKIAIALAALLLALCGCGNKAADTSIYKQSGNYTNKAASDKYEAQFSKYMSAEKYSELFFEEPNLVSAPVVSPDKTKIAYIYPIDFEIPTTLYVYDINKKQAAAVLSTAKEPLDKDTEIKSVSWLDNSTLLPVTGYLYGTVSIGGTLNMLDLNGNKLSPIYKPADSSTMVTKTKITNSNIELTIIKYNTNFDSYSSRTVLLPIPDDRNFAAAYVSKYIN